MGFASFPFFFFLVKPLWERGRDVEFAHHLKYLVLAFLLTICRFWLLRINLLITVKQMSVAVLLGDAFPADTNRKEMRSSAD